MKKFMLIIVLLISFDGFSQSYFPFPDSSAWWTVNVFPVGPPPVTIQYYILGDTLIGTNQYHKVYTYDTVSNYSNYFIAFRQDTSAKRIFMVNAQMTSEYLAYDFNLAAGDTFILDSITQFTVTIVDSVQVQGQYRKHMHLSPYIFSCLCPCYPDWIEGIGSLYGFLPVQCTELASISLECFGVNNQTVYPDTGTCTLFVPTGIDNDPKAIQNFIVLPNPFTSVFSINMHKRNIKKATFIVRDILGQTVFSMKETNLNNTYSKTIDLSFISNGIYSLEVIVDGERRVKKIIKE